jgi:hypothetical protein
MTLDAVREILALVTPIAITLGVLIAIFQLRDLRRMRQMDVVMQLFNRFDDDSFQARLQALLRWNFRGWDDFERRARPNDWVTLYSVSAYFENMGTLYKRRLASIDLLDDIMSGPITMAWEKTAPIWLGYRRKYDKPMFAEWFELLATDMRRRLDGLAARGDGAPGRPAPRPVKRERAARGAGPTGQGKSRRRTQRARVDGGEA